jgi:branched-chain amino acid transport system ATP-binding protein
VNELRAELSGAGYGHLTIVEDVALEVRGGEALVILGSNGAGKSTTLRALMGTVRAARRRLVLDGEELGHLRAWALPARGIVFVPDGARCFPNLTVLDNLRGAFQAAQSTRSDGGMSDALDEAYTLFPVLREKSRIEAGALSGGQRQMLAIARALMAEPRVLVLDEPSAGLAPKLVEELFLTLDRIKRDRHCAVVMAEQNVWYATRVADRCLVLEQGKVVLSGPMSEVAEDERLRTVYLGI